MLIQPLAFSAYAFTRKCHHRYQYTRHNYRLDLCPSRFQRGFCRRQLRYLVRLSAAPSSSSRSLKSPADIVRSLRELAKAQPRVPTPAIHPTGPQLDDRIHDLVCQFKSTTADLSRANSRDLGAVVWALGKLHTPCCCGHAADLLQALSASPVALLSASNQTLCNALYGAALLCRGESPGRFGGGRALGASDDDGARDGDGTGASPAAWQAVLAPAGVLASACVHRVSTFNAQDTSNLWWATATLATLPAPAAAAAPSVASAAAAAVASGGPGSGSTSGSRVEMNRQRPALHQPTRSQRAHGAGDTDSATGPLGPGGGRSSGFIVPPGLLEGLAAAAVRCMRAPTGGCRPQGVANMLWGACRLTHTDEAMLAAAVQLLTPQLQTLLSSEPRAIATCLWALATLRYPPARPLMSAASRLAAARLRAFDDQSLSNLLWAYGSFGVEAPRLFEAAAEEIIRRADRMGLQFLSISLWAFATVNHLDRDMMAAVAAALTEPPAAGPTATGGIETRRMRGGGSGKTVSQAGIREEAAASLGSAEAAFAERLAACDGRRTQVIGNLAWAYAALGARHEPLIVALVGRAAAVAPALSAQEISNVLYGVARLLPYMYDTHPEVLQALLREVDRRLPAPNTPPPASAVAAPAGAPPAHSLLPRDLAMISWSVAILAPTSPTLRRLLAAAVDAATGPAVFANSARAEATTAAATTAATAAATATAASADLAEDGDGGGAERRGEGGGAAAAGGGDGGVRCVLRYRDELQDLPYHLYGLVQLYGANYAWCLASAASGANLGDLVDLSTLRSVPDEPRQVAVGPGPSHGATSTGSATSDDSGGNKRSAVGALARAAAAAMRQAQSAAEAISRGRGSEAGDAASAGSVVPAPLGHGGSGVSEKGHRAPMVRFGPLGACPALYRACRDAWYLTTASTKPSELQTAVMAALRDDSGVLDGRDKASTGVGGCCGAVTTVAQEVLSPDRMLRADLLVQYDGWLVLLEVDGPTHFAVQLKRVDGVVRNRPGRSGASGDDAGAASAAVGGRGCSGVDAGGEQEASTDSSSSTTATGTVGPQEAVLPAGHRPQSRTAVAARGNGPLRGSDSGLQPLGDTVLRNRFLAASLGLTAHDQSSQTGSSSGWPYGTFSAASAEPDPWVVESLLERLEPCELRNDASSSSSLVRRTDEREGGIVEEGGQGGAEEELRVTRGVAVASLSYTEWNAAGPARRWAACLAPLLERVCSA